MESSGTMHVCLPQLGSPGSAVHDSGAVARREHAELLRRRGLLGFRGGGARAQRRELNGLGAQRNVLARA